jgi:hypothetical protein
MNPTELRGLLADLSPATRRLVLATRAMVVRTIPDAEESELWGSLSYHRPEVGGRVKGAVYQIGFKNDKARLDFIHGIRLTDPSGLLQGDQKSKRYVPIEFPDEVERPEIAALIREAAALDPTTFGYAKDVR